jgi:hypothetical protein
MTQTDISEFVDDTQPQTASSNTESDEEKQNEFILDGLRVNDPLAFLAALGVVRVLKSVDKIDHPTLSWSDDGSHWVPTLHLNTPLSRDRLTYILTEQLRMNENALRYQMSTDSSAVDKLSNLTSEEFRVLLENAPIGDEDERALGSYATDAFEDNSEIAEFDTREEGTALTRLNIVEFSGPLKFIKSQRKLIRETTQPKIRRTLFQLWDHDDNASELRTLRWSPTDASRGAYTGLDPNNLRSQTMHGANRLAIEGSRMHTVTPTETGSSTVGFLQLDTGEYVFQYPVWTQHIAVPTIRTLLTHPDIMRQNPAPEVINGVQKVLRAKIEINDRYRNLGRGIAVTDDT